MQQQQKREEERRIQQEMIDEASNKAIKVDSVKDTLDGLAEAKKEVKTDVNLEENELFKQRKNSAGRPTKNSKVEKLDKTPVAVYFTPEDRKRVLLVCEAFKWSNSGYITDLVLKDLEEHKEEYDKKIAEYIREKYSGIL